MMNANSHFGTLRYPLVMYTILFTYVAHYLNFLKTELVLIFCVRMLFLILLCITNWYIQPQNVSTYKHWQRWEHAPRRPLKNFFSPLGASKLLGGF